MTAVITPSQTHVMSLAAAESGPLPGSARQLLHQYRPVTMGSTIAHMLICILYTARVGAQLTYVNTAFILACIILAAYDSRSPQGSCALSHNPVLQVVEVDPTGPSTILWAHLFVHAHEKERHRELRAHANAHRVCVTDNPGPVSQGSSTRKRHTDTPAHGRKGVTGDSWPRRPASAASNPISARPDHVRGCSTVPTTQSSWQSWPPWTRCAAAQPTQAQHAHALYRRPDCTERIWYHGAPTLCAPQGATHVHSVHCWPGGSGGCAAVGGGQQ